MSREDGTQGTATHLRADARRNLALILEAARDVFAERGPDAPLDEVARRAGVGIATLYRRFPDRESLVQAVALDIWTRIAGVIQMALAEEPDAFRALERYMHRALDLRVGAVMPVLVRHLPVDADLRRARDQSAAAVQGLIDSARSEGTLRPDIEFGDIGLLLIRLSRPLPGPFPRAVDDALAHRHLELVIDGLYIGVDPRSGQLPGPAVTLENLRVMISESESA